MVSLQERSAVAPFLNGKGTICWCVRLVFKWLQRLPHWGEGVLVCLLATCASRCKRCLQCLPTYPGWVRVQLVNTGITPPFRQLLGAVGTLVPVVVCTAMKIRGRCLQRSLQISEQSKQLENLRLSLSEPQWIPVVAWCQAQLQKSLTLSSIVWCEAILSTGPSKSLMRTNHWAADLITLRLCGRQPTLLTCCCLELNLPWYRCALGFPTVHCSHSNKHWKSLDLIMYLLSRETLLWPSQVRISMGKERFRLKRRMVPF